MRLKRSLVVGANGGASFGLGGGAYIAARIVETLSESPDSEVGIVSLWGARPEVMVQDLGVRLPLSRIKSFFLFESSKPQEPSVGHILTPYTGAVLFSILRILARAIRTFDPQLIVFNDDIPRLVETLNGGRTSALYANFPYACRRSIQRDALESRSMTRTLSEGLARPFMKRLFEMEKLCVDRTMANSSVTKRHMMEVFDQQDIAVVHAPVDIVINNGVEKTNLVVALGPIQPNKRFAEIIRAMKLVKSDCRLLILGLLRDRLYYSSLVSLIKHEGLENRVSVLPSVPRDTIRKFLDEASVIVHAARFEPFGTSVVEGMAAGAVPVVYAGSNSGPWLDIIEQGRYGFGFEDPIGLADHITNLLDHSSLRHEYSEIARTRSTFFSPSSFSERFLNVLES